MRLEKIENITIGFSERKDGDLSFWKMTDDVFRKTWQKICKENHLDIPEPCFLKQVHENSIISVTNPALSGLLGEADALLSSCNKITLGIFTADCLPVIIFGEKSICAIHAGWKSTRMNITGYSIAKMAEIEGSSPSNLKLFMGPCIGSCCLEMGDEIPIFFDESDRSFRGAFSHGRKWHLDLRGLNCMQAISRGIKPSNISHHNDCTKCKVNSFFSFRGDEGRSGSMFSFISRN
ncbi:MAG: polyphenol oxidase family protein [Candidatus Riflebacteria bacterium]|nr:polyphenol oxidase family protein [Candidatus Riflebacteria bacterium]